MVDARTAALLQPGVPASCPAAEPLLTAAGHLYPLHPGQGVDHIAGGTIHPVVSPQVAGIVVGQPHGELLARRELARGDQLGQQLRVVDYLELAAQGRVFVAQRVEAVRAGGDDSAHAVARERLEVLARLYLVEELVAQPSGRVARAGLL